MMPQISSLVLHVATLTLDRPVTTQRGPITADDATRGGLRGSMS